jgi:undecaprenyl-phosphate 4-deoxy-4-formamido-L-arabinose transferase
VIPVYRGERHLPALLAEIAALVPGVTTSGGHRFRVAEVLLVHDCGPDGSDRVMRELSEQYEWVRPIWLSRNFGQHGATIAGMASSTSEWIVTLDEDGQHDPAEIAHLLDTAMEQGASLVYAAPTNPAPHPLARRVTSRAAKSVLSAVSGVDARHFHSFRLMLGELGRSVAAYAGQGVYLDIALGWVSPKAATAPVTLRDEGDRVSSYSVRTLFSHFWRMILTSGTRGLRLVSILGVVVGVAGVLFAAYLIIHRLSSGTVAPGWTSLMVVTLLCTGAILFSLGVVAEYIGIAVGMAMGRPLYLITRDRANGPLGRRPTHG